ncbi:MAG: acyl-CoA dehydrogenase [Candidatus Eremiobacteraeota bacterium]|nr:acyl-CoA dehydrogenase [Candidatus Eremiobacteraeota bacterium]MCW5865971.1 acyl-CoA dehydrogenase [Candidatus Eremiobacteraeota bacterium]
MIDGLEAFFDSRHREVAEQLTHFATGPMSAYATAHDDAEARSQTPEAVRLMGRAGWLQPQDSRTLCLFREAVAAVSPLADAVFAIQGLATVPLRLSGYDGPWLERACLGLAVGGFAMTEPEAGSDVANLQTVARPDGDSWRLNGHKWLISNAGIADYYVVFARFEGAEGSRGIGAFLVEREEVHFAGAQLLSAPHPLGQLEFHDAQALLLDREGFKLGMRTLDTMRVSVAAAACGMAGRALQEALEHARTRRQFGQALSEFQLIQAKLAQMALALESSRLLTYRAAWQRDQGRERNTREVAMAKAQATEQAQFVIDSAMQILGGRGMLADHPVEHLYRAVRALRIYEGTTEVQYLIIAKDLLR